MTLELLLEYVFYLAAIAVGLIVLWFIKQKTKLPTHSELKKRLLALRETLHEFIAAGENESTSGYDFFKYSSKCMYMTNKLAYTVTLMAQKEQDGDLSGIAVTMEGIRSLLSPYRFKVKGKEDLSDLRDALEKTDKAMASLDSILERDSALKAKHLHY